MDEICIIDVNKFIDSLYINIKFAAGKIKKNITRDLTDIRLHSF